MFSHIQLFTQALNLTDPWKLDNVAFDQEKGQLDIYISHQKGAHFPCPVCGAESGIHDALERTWRHLNFFQYRAYIHCHVPRCKCDRCGVKQVEVPWSRSNTGFTMLFEAFILELAAHMPINAIAKLVNEYDTRLWRIVDHYIQEARAKEDYQDISSIGIDETSRRRGHHYITVVADLDQSKVIYVTEGRDASTIKAFARDLKGHNGDPEDIEQVTCDMSPAYIKGIQENLTQAAITFDKFHVMKLVNEAVDQVRRQEQKENDILKYSRYVWLKNPHHLTERQLKQFTSLSRMKLKTVRAYNLKLSIQEFWKITDPDAAKRYLRKWYFWATHSRLEPMKELAAMIRNHEEGILNYIHTRTNNGILEGINSLIQATKRKARGYKSTRNLIHMIYLQCGKLQLDTPKAFAI